MRNKFSLAVFTIVVSFIYATQIQASPMQLTFEGAITGISDRDNILSGGFVVGDRMEYFVHMDTDVDGYRPDWTRITYGADYFEASISGQLLDDDPSAETSFYEPYSSQATYNYSEGRDLLQFFTSLNTTNVFIHRDYGVDASIEEFLTLGSTWDARESVHQFENSLTTTATLSGNLTLTSINGVTLPAEAPLPAAIWMLIVGLGCLQCVRKRYARTHYALPAAV